MCGIAGIFAYGRHAPPVSEVELLRLREAMAVRGPDGAGLWISPEGNLGLAHRRLAILDPSQAGGQPMATPDGAVTVVFNGEIYNFRDLRRELETRGHTFRSQSDTEVLLYLYREHGTEMVSRLRGMYAFAIWDVEKRGLFLARDPYGIKPLYYASDAHTFRFASQVKALARHSPVDSSPEPAGYVGFFLWGSVPEPYTLYQGIRALPAGSALWVDARGIGRPWRFFSISETLARTDDATSLGNEDELGERLRTALRDSVRHHLVADVPVGVFLSSGLDSSVLTALAAEANPGGQRTITLGFREYVNSEDDEVPLAEQVAKHYGCVHQTRWVSKEDFYREYDRFLEAMDQPSIDGLNTYFVSKAAAETGLKVALSGLGGDELFGGYPSFRDVPRLATLLSPFRLIPVLGKVFRVVSVPVLKRFTSQKYAGLLEYGGTYGGAYLLRRGLFMPWELPEILDGDMVREGWRELQPLARLEETVNGIGGARLKVTALESVWYLRNQLLRDTDWAGMAHSVEIRVPLVDVELLRSLKPLLATGPGVTKQQVAGVLTKPLPREILTRRKTGFTVPVRDWVLQRRTTHAQLRGLRGWAKNICEAYERAA